MKKSCEKLEIGENLKKSCEKNWKLEKIWKKLWKKLKMTTINKQHNNQRKTKKTVAALIPESVIKLCIAIVYRSQLPLPENGVPRTRLPKNCLYPYIFRSEFCHALLSNSLITYYYSSYPHTSKKHVQSYNRFILVLWYEDHISRPEHIRSPYNIISYYQFSKGILGKKYKKYWYCAINPRINNAG